MGVSVLASVLIILTFSVIARIDCATFKQVYVKVRPSNYSRNQFIFIEKGNLLKNYVTEASELRILNQFIPRLRPKSLGNLPRINIMEIKQCVVKKIIAGALKNLQPMRELKITHNELTRIGYGIFNGLTIRTLILTHNKISKIADGAFGNMTLEAIYLSYNRISQYRSEWFVGTPVHKIHINHNYIKELPSDASKYLRNVEPGRIKWSFSAQGNRIRKVKKDVLREVDEMDLFNLKENGLQELEPSLFHNVSLVHNVVLKYNNISEIPEGLFKNTVVTNLYLQWNNLRCISLDSIKYSVRYLYVEGNPFTCRCVKMLKEWQATNGYQNFKIIDFERVLLYKCIDK